MVLRLQLLGTHCSSGASQKCNASQSDLFVCKILLQLYSWLSPAVCLRAAHWPAATPGRTRPGTGRIWWWWCVSGCSRSATFSCCRWGPSSRRWAAPTGFALPPDGRGWPPPGSWLRRARGLGKQSDKKANTRWVTAGTVQINMHIWLFEEKLCSSRQKAGSNLDIL